MALSWIKPCKNRSATRCAGGVRQPGVVSRRRVRLVCGCVFLILAACLLITSLTLVPVRKAKLKACWRDGLQSGAISAEALDSSRGESTYSYYCRRVYYGQGEVPEDPYMAMCWGKHPMDHYGDPVWTATAAVLAVFFAVVLFTHTQTSSLVVALLAVLGNAVAWAAAYAIMPVSRKKFHDCMRKLLASGVEVDESQYSQYYKYGVDPTSDLGPSQDPGVERCNAKYTPSIATVFGLYGFAAIYGCILLVYLVVVIIVMAIRRFCCCCCRKRRAAPVPQELEQGRLSSQGGADETLRGKESSAFVTKAALEPALPNRGAVPNDISAPMPPTEV